MDDYYSPLKMDHAERYDDQPRMEVVGLVERSPERVLEIGCGSGATGRAVKQKFPAAVYVGVEIDAGAAERAREGLDEVICGDIERMTPDGLLGRGPFDLVICNDVLEHLYDPWKVLHLLRGCLKPGGLMIASIPNVQNIGLVMNLIGGSWTYTPFGLLDATHIRFFTLKEIQRLFLGGGFRIVSCNSVLQGRIDDGDWPRDLELGRVVIRGVSREEAGLFLTFQYIVMAEKEGA